ncbi:MAG: hypothetical protein QUV20_13260 [Oceanibaculum nanhaiense]|uniref:hypothetical protein n=1 Tax=Oceanibaculum nanhaiense TaxID=1909734 RepID=UPI0025A4C308|nr:hypothetical protein [Oceanibaculum nanhaiense]MDM7947290.1 hypothetical protein [Oceanibaculum nanhaiense]
MQELLLAEIIRTEERIRSLKKELKIINSETPCISDAKEKRSIFIKNRIEGLRRCAFIWRSFGDAIAFLYMDKYALKQTLYNIDNYNQKQSAGFISGKVGLSGELNFLNELLKNGIPALLVDITNTIRHGDICAMMGPDPILVEVKAQKGKINPRGRKQARGLAMLDTLFSTDKVDGLRGAQEIRRRELKVTEKNYLPLMNVCILTAMKEDYSIKIPEKGLLYVALGKNAPPIKDIFADISFQPALTFVWNIKKSQQTWVPFTPFTLSIENRDALWEFVQGEIFILVSLEIDRLIEIAKDYGTEINYDAKLDAEYPIQFKRGNELGFFGISGQMIERIGFECISPETLIHGVIETYRDLIQQFPDTENYAENN